MACSTLGLLGAFACSKDRAYPGKEVIGTAGLGGESGESSASGGAAGSHGETPLAFESSELSTAQLNQTFTTTLQTEGGNGALTFELTEGDLPPGLTLSDSGELSGTPRVTGSYTFTVRVKDAKGASATVELTLVVSQRDWLVYRSDKAERFLKRLYAVQLSSALLPVTEIAGGELPTTASVELMKFSPDGQTLAFVAGASSAYDVYVVDMSKKVPGKPKALGFELTSFATLDFSPDGKRLAHSSYSEVKIVDLSEASPVVQSLGEGKQARWVSNTQLAFLRVQSPNSKLMRANWPAGGELEIPQELPITGFCFGATCSEYFYARPDLSLYEYIVQNPGFTITERHTLFSASDSTWSTNSQEGPPVSPLSRDYALGVQYNFLGNALGIVELPALTAEKTLPDVGDVWRWANTSHKLLISSTSDEFQLVDADAETLDPQLIEGSYGTPDGSHCRHRFAPNDAWVALFDTTGNVYASALGSDGPGTAKQIGTAVDRGVFSPDSRFYAYSGDELLADAVDLFLVDLSSGSPTAAVQLNARTGNDTERDVQTAYAGPCGGHDVSMPDYFHFSPNSSHLAHLEQQGTAKALWVTSLLDPKTGELAEGRKAVNCTGFIECEDTACGSVELDFAFQP